MHHTRTDRLPPVVYARISPRRADLAAALLRAAGFRVVASTPISLGIAGPPEAYEAAFATRLVVRDLPVTMRGRCGGPATIIDTVGDHRLGYLDPVGTALAGAVEWGTIDLPRHPARCTATGGVGVDADRKTRTGRSPKV
jgi:hypothetical protein